MSHKHISFLEGIMAFAAGLLAGFSLRERIEAKTDNTMDVPGAPVMKPEKYFTEEEVRNNAHC